MAEVEIYKHGRRLYSGLVDDGSNVMRFKSGWGFITKDQVKAKGWQVIRVASDVQMAAETGRMFESDAE